MLLESASSGLVSLASSLIKYVSLGNPRSPWTFSAQPPVSYRFVHASNITSRPILIIANSVIILASIKVLTIVGLIILGLVIDLGGAPNHDRLGFRFWVGGFAMIRWLFACIFALLFHIASSRRLCSIP